MTTRKTQVIVKKLINNDVAVNEHISDTYPKSKKKKIFKFENRDTRIITKNKSPSPGKNQIKQFYDLYNTKGHITILSKKIKSYNDEYLRHRVDTKLKGYDLTWNSPALVRARKPLYGLDGRLLRSNLSIFKPDRAMPITRKPTWKVGNTRSRSTPVSSTNVPDIEGALSFGIRPIVHKHVCKYR